MNAFPDSFDTDGTVGRSDIRKSIVICDANPILAESMRILFAQNSVLSEFSITLLETPDIGTLTALSPDILIIDPSQSPDWAGLTQGSFLDVSKTTAVILYCPEMPSDDVRELSLVGVRGYIPKTAQGEDLVRIVCAVAFGGVYLPEKPTKTELSVVEASSAGPAASLSEREIDVLRYIALGRSMKEIAANLQISAKTVDTYKTRALQKLDLRSRSDIVRYAIESGWLQPQMQLMVVK